MNRSLNVLPFAIDIRVGMLLERLDPGPTVHPPTFLAVPKTTVYRIRWARLARLLGLAFFLENAGQTANSGANFLQFWANFSPKL